jgi:hypothetical protein
MANEEMLMMVDDGGSDGGMNLSEKPLMMIG